VTGRWKGTKEEDEWSEETLLKLARLFAGLQFLAGGEGGNLLVSARSRGEELPARLDKTVLEIPADK